MLDTVKLASFLEEKLNENAQALVFRTYTFEKTLDKRYERNFKATTDTNFIPSIIETPLGSYLPMNDVRGMRLSFNLTICLPLTEKYNWLDMVEQFVYKINGKMFYLYLGEFVETRPTIGTFTSVKMTCQVPSFGAVTPMNFASVAEELSKYVPISNTQNYVIVSVPIAIKTSDNVNIGDESSLSIATPIGDGEAEWVASTQAQWDLMVSEGHTEYQLDLSETTEFESTAAFVTYLNGVGYEDPKLHAVARSVITDSSPVEYIYAQSNQHQANLDYYKLKTYDLGDKNAKVPETVHFEALQTGTTHITQNDVKFVASAYYERGYAILDNLVKNICEGTNQNYHYWVKRVLPSGYASYAECLVFDNSASYPTDDFSIISLAFTRAF